MHVGLLRSLRLLVLHELILLQPPQPLPLHPLALLRLVPLFEDAKPVLLPSHPLPNVLAAVWPGEGTLAALLVLHVESAVLAAVGPGEEAPAVHPAALPLAVVLPAVAPGVDALAMDAVVEELARVYGALDPGESAGAAFDAVLVLTPVLRAVGPCLRPLAVLLIPHPLADVHRAVLVPVRPMAVGPVGQPVALVDIAVGVDERPYAVGLIADELARVLSSIRPHLDALTVARVAYPLPDEDGPVLEADLRAGLAERRVARPGIFLCHLLVLGGHGVLAPAVVAHRRRVMPRSAAAPPWRAPAPCWH
mmetsp:Transcript_40194/g.90735  ORF Transcript_40194/g.90735 Transcript_40194/m.90735 type:complete len:307 (-) Transcript_40194:18-938(-)